MLLRGAAKYLGLEGEPKNLYSAVRQQTETLQANSVNLKITAASCPEGKFSIDHTFTSDMIILLSSYPVEKLKQSYSYLLYMMSH